MTPTSSSEVAVVRLGPAPHGSAKALTILLHGVGSSASAMRPLAEDLSQACPEMAFTCLDGVAPFDLGPAGRQWFSVDGVSEANRAARVAEAVPHLERLVARELHHHGLPATRAALLGFSQGAIMALHLATSSELDFGAVVALAGRIAEPMQARPGPKPPVLLSHGAADEVIPIEQHERAAARLRALGCEVVRQLVPHHGHSVHAAQVRAAASHLMAHLPC